MSGTFPTSPEAASVLITNNQTTLVSTAISGRRQARQLQNQRWGMRVAFPAMTRADFNPIFAFITQQRGRKESFQYTPPIFDDTLGTETGSVLVNGSHSVGDTTNAATVTIEPPLTTALSDNDTVVYNSVSFTVALKNDIQQIQLPNDAKFRYEMDLIEVI